MIHLIFIGKIVLSAGILWLVARQVELDQAFRQIGAFSGAGLAGVMALLALQQLVAATRLSLVLRTLDRALSVASAFRITLIGVFFTQTFLSFLGGDASRLWQLRNHGIGLREATSGVFLDRLISFISNHLLVVACLPWLLTYIEDDIKRGAIVALVVAGLLMILALFVLAQLRERLRLDDRLPRRLQGNRLVRVVLDVLTVLRPYFAHPRLAAAALATSLVTSAVNAAIIFVLFADLGEAVSFWQCLVLVPLVIELAMVPITIAGWGVREGLMVVAFGTVGVAADSAFLASVMFGLAGLAFGLLGCAAWLLSRAPSREVG